MSNTKTRREITVNRVSCYIFSHIEKNLSLDFLSDNVAYMSPYHLHKIFKIETGFSLGRFIMLVRMNKAGDLLLSTDYSINDVSSMCGFKSLSVFYRNFRKYFNTSPACFVENIIQLQLETHQEKNGNKIFTFFDCSDSFFKLETYTIEQNAPACFQENFSKSHFLSAIQSPAVSLFNKNYKIEPSGHATPKCFSDCDVLNCIFEKTNAISP